MYLLAHTHSHIKTTNAKIVAPVRLLTWPQTHQFKPIYTTIYKFSFHIFKYLLFHLLNSTILTLVAWIHYLLEILTYRLLPCLFILSLFWNFHTYWAHNFIFHCNVEGFCCTFTLSQLYWFVFCFFDKYSLIFGFTFAIATAINRWRKSHIWIRHKIERSKAIWARWTQIKFISFHNFSLII